MFTALAMILALSAAPSGQQAPMPTGTPAQREAMQALAWMDGEWVGTAETTLASGETQTHPHTERIGPMLGGSIKLIEGTSYGADGEVQFNAVAVLSVDRETGAYSMRSYANGRAGDFPLELTERGWRWSTAAGPNARMVYDTIHEGGRWVETGDYVAEGQAPRRVVTLRLTRTGDTAWPAADPVRPER